MKVVVLSFNHPGITAKCIASAQKHFDNKNIFLVHNGSQEKFVIDLKNKFPEINHLIFADNLGFTGGANRGFKVAFENESEMILFLSNDCVISEYKNIDKTCDLMALHVELRETGQVASYGGLLDFKRGRLSHVTTLSNKSLKENFYVPGSAFVISKKAWLETGGFDETLHSYWDDVDLSLRAKKMGLKLSVGSQIRIKHGVAKTTGQNPYYTTYLYLRNQKRVILRHAPWFSRNAFKVNYALSISRKLFKSLKNKDYLRAKLILKALR